MMPQGASRILCGLLDSKRRTSVGHIFLFSVAPALQPRRMYGKLVALCNSDSVGAKLAIRFLWMPLAYLRVEEPRDLLT